MLDDWRWQHPEVFLGEYIEVSAKTGRNVDLALKYVVAALAHINGEVHPSSSSSSSSSSLRVIPPPGAAVDAERLHSSAGAVMQKTKKRSSCLLS
jgi:hypothetical protein